ncbi:hypothetical protein O181_057258 [Austropuccinia psidii MF-1]|uniref:Uncharacterized protein n=1 Tax=Austropuccinia psidii MF-1 TaxID=1389203 RepID=A0A9Q3EEN5_9BASI|nr:hypothetical protein [Austropuccinia psidii MF-1]
MNFGDYNRNFPNNFQSSSNHNLLQIVNDQSEHIRKLEAKIDSHDQEFAALLTKFNLHDQNKSEKIFSNKSKDKRKDLKQVSSTKNWNQPEQPKNNSSHTSVNSKIMNNKSPHTHSKIFKQQTSTPPRKRSPHQLLNSEIPEAFQPTKKAFYKHIKILWGLIYQHSIPISPDYSMLKEFNCHFSFLSDIEAQSENPNTQPLVPLE